jgi:hypothetical protein
MAETGTRSPYTESMFSVESFEVAAERLGKKKKKQAIRWRMEGANIQ